MNNEKAWPNPDYPGVPQNHERDGWHWIASWTLAEGWQNKMPWCAKWVAERGVWAEVEADVNGEMADWTPATMAAGFNYICPCPTPDQIMKAETKMMTLHQAQQIRTFIRDLEDIDCNRANMSNQFLADQDDEVREYSWNAALDMAESIIKSRLRALGVDV